MLWMPLPRCIQGQAGCGSGQQPVVGDPAHSEGLKLDDLRGPSQPRPFYDSTVTYRSLKIIVNTVHILLQPTTFLETAPLLKRLLRTSPHASVSWNSNAFCVCSEVALPYTSRNSHWHTQDPPELMPVLYELSFPQDFHFCVLKTRLCSTTSTL